MRKSETKLLGRFERRDIKPDAFAHRDHLQVAYEMLDRYDFADACLRYAMTIRKVAEAAGAPEKYNTTITFAFMSLIAERKSRSNGADWETFLASNIDLLEKDVLRGWYLKERISSKLAREQFLLPDQLGGRSSALYRAWRTALDFFLGSDDIERGWI